MTSLEQLCHTNEQRSVAKRLADNGIVTDADLLLAPESTLKASGLSPDVSNNLRNEVTDY